MSLDCRVLILDDEESIRFSLQEMLTRQGYQVQAYADPLEALEELRGFRPQIVVADYSLPRMDGLEFMSRVHAKTPDTIVIFMTAYGTEEVAVEAMKRGAYDYFKKPFRNDAVLVSIAKAREKLELLAENRRLRDEASEKGAPRDLVGTSRQMREIHEMVDRIANTGVTVLILGESGTGKELVAQMVHRRSNRVARPFVRLNCAAIPESLVESELFGYEAGAFSGATKSRKGKFEQADGGTIFLDEIGDMPPAVQAKVLRVLQEREIERLGDNRVRPVDVRVVAATHQDLEEKVAEGTFREDLLYRLNVVTLRIPPLRERREDIPVLVGFFLEQYREKFGVPPMDLSDEVLERLMAYDWPGNVRELENTLARALLLRDVSALPGEGGPGGAPRPARARPADAAAAPEAGSGPEAERSATQAPGTGVGNLVDLDLPYREAKRELLDRFEDRYLSRLLERTGGNVSRAARMAGMHRKNFYEKLQRLGLADGGPGSEDGG